MITLDLQWVLILLTAGTIGGFVIATLAWLIAWMVTQRGDRGVRMYKYDALKITPPGRNTKNIRVEFLEEASDEEIEEMEKPAWHRRLMEKIHVIKKDS